MENVRISRSLCTAIADAIVGSHPTLDALYLSAGAPTPPPELPHSTKWKTWLFQAGTDPNVDSLAFLGNLLEEFMDVSPEEPESVLNWHSRREKVVSALEESGLRYFRGGRVLPKDEQPSQVLPPSKPSFTKPSSIEELLSVLLPGLRRAMHPLTHRRKGAHCLSFDSEYDVQDLLHALLRPWVKDIRPEEFTPSYAGSSTRMDFLLPAQNIVIELKLVRDRQHGKKLGDELIIDIEHYRRHSQCDTLWCVVYDPDSILLNADGLKNDLGGARAMPDGKINVRVLVI
jgi:hypothetical protein